MNIAPDFAAYLEQVAAVLGPLPSPLTIAARRARAEKLARHFSVPDPRLHDRRLEFVPAPGREIPARVYVARAQAAAPAVLYLHGGGWVAGSIDSHDSTAAGLAAATGATVVSVHYRRPPENPHPAAIEDCLAALDWMAANAGHLGIDPGRIAVAGDSAGGQLAASCALAHRGSDRIAFQLLIYPVTDADMRSDSYRLFGGGPLLTQADMAFYWDAYLAGRLDTTDHLAVPARATDLTGLPPAYVVSAEIDPLRDEAEAYAARLERAGTRVALRRAPGLAHGFLRARGVAPSAQAEFERMAAALAGAFG